MQAVRNADEAAKLRLIKAHPDLAGKAARAGALTADSHGRASQRRPRPPQRAGIRQLPSPQRGLWRRNSAFPSSSACAGTARIRSSASSRLRLVHELAREFDTALSEIFRIAALRLDQQVDGAGQIEGAWPAVDPCARHPWRPSGAGRRARIARIVVDRRRPAAAIRRHQRRRPHRRAADCRPAAADRRLTNCASRSAIISPGAAWRWPTRRFSTWCRSASASPSRRAITTCRWWSRPGAMRLIGGAETFSWVRCWWWA